MSKFAVGDLAPDFSLEISEGKTLSLENLRGKYVVLYFYPKDSTPGCTIEARDFNSLKKDFTALGAEIIGVSKDPLTSHDKFRKNHDLQFYLGSDTNGDVCEKFSVWVEKSMFGKKNMRYRTNATGKTASEIHSASHSDQPEAGGVKSELNDGGMNYPPTGVAGAGFLQRQSPRSASNTETAPWEVRTASQPSNTPPASRAWVDPAIAASARSPKAVGSGHGAGRPSRWLPMSRPV